MKKTRSLVIAYIYLAAGSFVLGVVLIFALLLVCQYLGVDVSRHFWLVGIPVILAIAVNVLLVELYDKFRSK